MNIFEAILLGIIQGLTEFLPVSSSGHLIIAEKLFGIGTGSLVFDVALHAGTLTALIVFFWRDLVALAKGLVNKNEYSRLARILVIATLPAVLAGIILERYAQDTLRAETLVAVNLIVVAILMLLAERHFKSNQNPTPIKATRTSQALVMGVAQAVALIPGVSRSGSTITAGLFVGMDRVAATRFSFLLGIPITTGALIKTLISNEGLAQIKNEQPVFLCGVLAALLSGIVAIKFMISFLSRYGLSLFAYYRIALGVAVLLIALANA